MLSSTAEYALRAVLYVAQHAARGPVRVSQIAQALTLPRNYLSKILHELARSGVLVSTRGKHGGFRLGQPAESLALYEVVNRFDRIEARRSCLLGRPECSDRQACLVHWRWKSLSEQVARFFRDTTVAELVSGAAAHPQSKRRVAND